MTTSLTRSLAEFTVALDFDDLPSEAVNVARSAILDCVGCILAGTHDEAVDIFERVAVTDGGNSAATAFGRRRRLPVSQAAFINGLAGHVLDLDDTSPPLIGHPSVPLVPAIFAVAESTGASGREAIAAYAVGFDVEARLGRLMNPSHYAQGWHATSTLGTLAAAAASAKLLGLDVKRTRNAVGIAASGAAGLRQNFGSMVKSLHAGQAAATGVRAAQLAAAGFESDPDILDGRHGFVRVLRGEEHRDPDPTSIRFDTSQPLELVTSGVGIKRYACCGCTHTALDGLLDLVAEHGFEADSVKAVEAGVNALAPEVLIHHEVDTPLKGKFSMEYCLAVALIDGEAGPAQFSASRVADPAVQSLMKRVRMYVHDDIPVIEGVFPCELRVQLADGREFTRRVNRAKGHPREPLSPEQLADKYRNCAAAALDPAAVEESLAILLDLESQPDTRALCTVLHGRNVLNQAN